MSTRRAAGAVSLTAAVLLVAGCGGADQGSAGGDTAARLDLVQTTAKATGGVDRINWLLEKEPDSFDLDLQASNQARTVMANVCERLFQLGPDLVGAPHLAEKAAWTDDRTLVLTLRHDVTFHDGSPMTADDVVYSLKRHSADGAEESDKFANVKSIDKTGEFEVTVKLGAPDALFLKSLAGDAGIVLNRSVIDNQGEDYGTPGHTDACSGPFVLKNWQSGTSVTIERAANYWDKANSALSQTVVFRWATDSTLVNSFTAGEADGSYVTSSTGPVVALQKQKGVDVYFGPSSRAWSLIPTDRGPMKNKNIRKALALSLDRQGVAKSGFSGVVQPWASPVGSGAWGYEKERFEAAQKELEPAAPASPSEEDLTKAKELVKKAGAAADETIRVVSDGTQGRSVIANAVRAAGQSIGLKVDITTVPPARFQEYYSDKKVRSTIDIIADDWYISTADPLGFYDNALSGSSDNWVGFSDPQYDAQVTKALGTRDDAARADLAIEVQKRFLDNMVWIPLVQVPSTLILSDRLTGAPASGIAPYSPWAAKLGKKGQ
ncbi:ABC transporter substrate-binding protein [Streptomyces sp. AD681]|uniref:ABC transporter substrate-binding protein n=1 Tax=Streptomyces sp. AD681 TaxID=3019069 RepID=UPI0022F1BC88|nr:ABC transporter substrate-binding protein [Streptomyces sp. AD681]MDA5145661.1 ABC transporter substrate-binding protein [Streptomyces sp. AD681]